MGNNRAIAVSFRERVHGCERTKVTLRLEYKGYALGSLGLPSLRPFSVLQGRQQRVTSQSETDIQNAWASLPDAHYIDGLSLFPRPRQLTEAIAPLLTPSLVSPDDPAFDDKSTNQAAEEEKGAAQAVGGALGTVGTILDTFAD